MGRKRFFSAGRRTALVTALAASMALVTASVASAANSCTTGTFPVIPGGASGLRVACLLDVVTKPVDPALNPNISKIVIHDATNVAWHRGAARSVATAVGGAPLNNVLTGGLKPEDVGRPISGPGIKGGAFVMTVSGSNGTMSQTASAVSPATVPKLIEHSTSRVLLDAAYTTAAGPANLTSATAKFVAGDVGKSVSGGGFGPGSQITTVNSGSTVEVTPPADESAGQVLTGAGTVTALTGSGTLGSAATGNGTLNWGSGNGTLASGSKIVNSAAAGLNITSADVGATVTGTGIPASTTIASVQSSVKFTMSKAATATGAKALVVKHKVVTSWTGTALTAADVGRTVTGTGVPTSTTIASVQATNKFTMSDFPTANGVKALSIKSLKVTGWGGTALDSSNVGNTVSGTGIAAGSTIKTVDSATAFTMNKSVTATGSPTLTLRTKFVTGWGGTALAEGSDTGAAVSGTGIQSGTTISAVTAADEFTLSKPATDTLGTLTITEKKPMITIGGAQYSGGDVVYTSTYNREMAKTTGATCSGTTTTGTLTSTAAGGGFVADDKYLSVTFLNGATVVAGTRSITTGTPGLVATITSSVAPACPTTWTHVVIGIPGGNAPKNGDVMASLAASMNLDPFYAPTMDNCDANTYEGFGMIGRWYNPGSYLPAGLGETARPPLSTGQIAFPVSVFSFTSYIVPVGTDSGQTGQHFDFIFPSIPTTMPTCPLGGSVTTDQTLISLGFNSVVQNPATPLAIGSGNPSAPPLRALGPQTGAFAQKVGLASLVDPTGTILSPTGCTIAAATAVLSFGCGIG